jgi:hypothetical protein
VRIQQTGNGTCNPTPCIESGYNTDNPTQQFETKDAGGTNWDHSLKLTNIGLDANGNRVFVLDINESKNDDRFLSLDKLQVYMADSATLNNFQESNPDCLFAPTSSTCGSGGLIGAHLVYDMDGTNHGGPGDSTVGLDYSLNNGSGKGIDLVVRIPNSYFLTNVSANPNDQYVYLYSSFGATGTLDKNDNWKPGFQGSPAASSPAGLLPAGNYGQSAGFEEWSSKVGKTPEPMTASLFLIGLAALGIARRQRTSAST